jgi:hypothetical protein
VGEVVGEGGDGAVGEDVAGGEVEVGAAGGVDELDGEDGVAAEVEEVVVDADAREA